MSHKVQVIIASIKDLAIVGAGILGALLLGIATDGLYPLHIKLYMGADVVGEFNFSQIVVTVALLFYILAILPNYESYLWRLWRIKRNEA